MVDTIQIAMMADAHSVPVGETEPTGREGGRVNLQQWREDVEVLLPDAALAVGDISDIHAGAADAASLIADMDNLFAGHGNHDLAEGGSGDKSTQKAAFRALYNMPDDHYAVDLDFLRLIMLDACFDSNGVPEAITAGNIPAAQITWLVNELDALSSNQPALVVCHHNIGEGTAYMAQGSQDALSAALASRPNVWLLMGHRHPSARRWHNAGTRPGIIIRALCDERWSLVTVTRRCGGLCTIDVTEQVVEP